MPLLKSWMVGVTVLFAQAACATDEEPMEQCSGGSYYTEVRTRPLAQFPRLVPHLKVHTARVASGDSRVIELLLEFGTVNNRGHVPALFEAGTDISYCLAVDSSFSATVAGQRVPGPVRGSWVCDGTGGPACVVPKLPIAVPADSPNAELVIADKSFSMTIPLGDVLRVRDVTPISSADWSFRANETAEFRWSPAADLVALSGEHVMFRTAAGASLVSEVARGAETLGFTMPDRIGQGVLAIELLGFASTRDTPFRISSTHLVEHAATVTR